MRRDYAKSKSRRSRYDKSSQGGWMWLVAGIMAGLLIAGLIYLQQQKKQEHQTPKSSATHVANHLPSKTTMVSAKPSPQFDFYTILPKMQVGTPQAAANTGVTAPTPQPSQQNNVSVAQDEQAQASQHHVQSKQETALQEVANPPQTIPSSPPAVMPITAAQKPQIRFVLQVASTRNYADADRMKAELTLQGYTVFVQKVKFGQGEWNRVYVGPFNSRASAQNQQAGLKSNHVESIIVKLPAGSTR